MIRHRKEAHLEDIIKAVRWEFCLTFYDVTKCHKEMSRHRKEAHLEDIIRAVRWDGLTYYDVTKGQKEMSNCDNRMTSIIAIR